ncbi:hypothetical protein DFH27DRAFT_47377 [Peziza echinospora]|nr:hypothetical protein DFH27DRAFT_47377 [Peziza echinospora]
MPMYYTCTGSALGCLFLPRTRLLGVFGARAAAACASAALQVSGPTGAAVVCSGACGSAVLAFGPVGPACVRPRAWVAIQVREDERQKRQVSAVAGAGCGALRGFAGPRVRVWVPPTPTATAAGDSRPRWVGPGVGLSSTACCSFRGAVCDLKPTLTTPCGLLSLLVPAAALRWLLQDNRC